ncbi:MAG TPA: flagellar motor protein [Bryobacteraceae bacterium]|nr:flagellar motor protein [Bryobacteraceae bacterium]
MAENKPETKEEPGKKDAKPKKAKKQSSSGPDLATILGFIVAFGGIGAGFMMEHGNPKDIAQITAALIVLGGTLGAVMITTPLNVVMRAAARLPSLFFPSVPVMDAIIDEIIGYAGVARKSGIVSLEAQASNIKDPFLKKALGLAVDGIETSNIRDIMELEMSIGEHRDEAEAKVFEAAGGYAPTIGIIGAVLGLIQVMKNLANIEEVGRGIAVAFVATIYGVATANIVFLPAANKLKARAAERMRARELMLEGVLSIAEGLNQNLIRMKLSAYSEKHEKPAREKAKKKADAKAGAKADAPPNAAPAEG